MLKKLPSSNASPLQHLAVVGDDLVVLSQQRISLTHSQLQGAAGVDTALYNLQKKSALPSIQNGTVHAPPPNTPAVGFELSSRRLQPVWRVVCKKGTNHPNHSQPPATTPNHLQLPLRLSLPLHKRLQPPDPVAHCPGLVQQRDRLGLGRRQLRAWDGVDGGPRDRFRRMSFA